MTTTANAASSSRPRSMREAIRDAIRTAGGNHLEIGGKLAVQYTGDGQAERGLNPPKLYKAEYKIPEPAAADNGGGLIDNSPF